jgi:hypothetical protein
MLGQAVSVAGVWVSMLSYLHCYEPTLINAAEGGMQQLFGLGLACATKHRQGVQNLRTKLLSAVMVTSGLMLTVDV